MANSLVPCGGCGRHVRASESACPFCGATVNEEARARAVPAASSRMGRNAMFVFATTLALSGCAASTSPTDSGVGSDAQPTDSGLAQDGGGPMPLYGGPVPFDGGPDVQDTGSIQAMYGTPAPVDAATDSAMNLEGGGIGPLYGGPIPVDAGVDNDSGEGGPGLRYGAPPPSYDV